MLVTDEDLKWLLKSSAVNLITTIEEQTLKVEEELLQQRGTSASGYICHLQHIALNFIRHKSNIYPLTMARIPRGRKTVTSKFPESPGVYFIYYVGKTDLYKGSQVFPSLNNPVYVGMSETNISVRLRIHGGNIENARNLNLADFVVRFLIVDVKYYARCIEGLMIDYFSPVWNYETVGLAFGNAAFSLWYQCHGNINPENDPDAYEDAEAMLHDVLKYLEI